VMQEKSNLTVSRFTLNEFMKRIDDVKLAVLKDEEAECAVSRLTKKHMERASIDKNVVVYHNGLLKFHNPPIASGSPGSDARYHIWDEDTGLLLQYLPKDSHTSCNYHRDGSEMFYNVSGICYICFCDGKDNNVKLLKGSSFNISPYFPHKLGALYGPAVNIILMPPKSGMSDHHYLKKCIKEC